MRLPFRRGPEPDDDDGVEENAVRPISEERDVQVSRPRSRWGSTLGIWALLGVLICGLVGMIGYGAFGHEKTGDEKAVEERAKMRPGEGAGQVETTPPKPQPAAPAPREPAPAGQTGLGALSGAMRPASMDAARGQAPGASAPGQQEAKPETPAERRQRLAAAELQRKLAATVTVTRSGAGAAAGALRADLPRAEASAMQRPPEPGQQQEGGLGSMLRATAAPVGRATPAPDRAWTIPGGAVADCTVITATDSTLAGLGLVELASDLRSEDGYNRLAKAGSTVMIEQRAGVRQGQDRVSLVAARMMTTEGIRVPMTTPLSDELGRPGMSGDVNKHWWDKLGGAVILTGVQAVGTLIATAGSKGNGNTNVVLSPQNAQSVITEMVKDTMSIANTVTLPHAARCSFIVFNDIYFGEDVRDAIR